MPLPLKTAAPCRSSKTNAVPACSSGLKTAVRPLRKSAAPYACLTPLESTLASCLISVDSKALTEKLSPLESTLTKARGGGLH